MMLRSDFWDDRRKSQSLINEQKKLRTVLDRINNIERYLSNCKEFLNEYKKDNDIEELFTNELNDLSKTFSEFEISMLLSEPLDNNNAILEFHPGAGGVESHDWAEMLFRMYVRYAEQHNYQSEVIDYQVGEEAGIKSATLMIKGENVYGLLKGEKGVHRLVRISPFDSASRRHTSFASVDVMPEISEDIDIEIKDEDIKVDTYRSSGAGGQHINKTESAIRITHLPSGIVVTCQSQRSQIQNREKALEVLKSRLYSKRLSEKREELKDIQGEQKSIEWGSQIRSYVFCPYTLVKDNRTNLEVNDVESVMNGDIDKFIYAYLKNKNEK
jgi:peptide chain release factor 2